MEKVNRDTRMDAVEGVTPLGGDSTALDRLTESDLGPFFLLFCLFIAGFGICAGGMILVVLRWRIALALLLLVPIAAGVVVEVSGRWVLKNHRGGSTGRIRNETDKLAIVLGWCFPRKHREAIVGDILEDCKEMRERGLAERKIRTHVLWQWAVSMIVLILGSIMSAIRAIVVRLVK